MTQNIDPERHGWNAFAAGKLRTDNPYSPGAYRDAWDAGWREGAADSDDRQRRQDEAQ